MKDWLKDFKNRFIHFYLPTWFLSSIISWVFIGIGLENLNVLEWNIPVILIWQGISLLFLTLD